MSKYESSIKQIPYPQHTVYDQLSNLDNIEKVKNHIPLDKLSEIKDLRFDRDSVSISMPTIGSITLRIIERDEPKCIKFQTEDSPIPLTLWIQLLPLTDSSCKMKLTLQANIPIFLRPMIGNRLGEMIEQVADALANIPYDMQ
ncbi:MAG: SRPBCC family protein [Prevotella sp.]|nr:SRPBCC family protein [Prevotella sp.]